MPITNVNYLIVGAGPAGLTAAKLISSSLRASCIVFDSGKPLAERDHSNPNDLGIGVGGAGIFSDGKFSYYPSGTELYNLGSNGVLVESYNRVMADLSGHGIITHEYNPQAVHRVMTKKMGLGEIYRQAYMKKLTQEGIEVIEPRLKPYPSEYANLTQRIKLTECLSKGYNIKTNTTVKTIEDRSGHFEVIVEDSSTGEELQYRAQKIILATGRTGPLQLEDFGVQTYPLRYEFGIRIETQLGEGTFLDEGNIKYGQFRDVKLISPESNGVEIRTFCTCRGGEIANIRFNTFSAISGRSEPGSQKTSYANFGLLMKFKGASYEKGAQLYKELMSNQYIKSGKAMCQTLQGFLSNQHEETLGERPWIGEVIPVDLNKELSEDLTKELKGALKTMLGWSRELDNKTSVILCPTIEGFGEYPKLDDQELQVSNKAMWVAGDISGKFRGLVPALVSGYYAATKAMKYAREYTVKEVRDKYISFDIDGTLIKGTSVMLYFAQHVMGNIQKIQDLEAQLKNHKINEAQFAQSVKQEIDGLLEVNIGNHIQKLPYIYDIKETVNILKEKGYNTAVVTSGPKKIAQAIAKFFGIDHADGTDFEGAEISFMNAQGKVDAIRKWIGGGDVSKVIAVGDSKSDVELFKVAKGIALNGDEHVKQHTHRCIDSDTLLDILHFVEQLEVVDLASQGLIGDNPLLVGEVVDLIGS